MKIAYKILVLFLAFSMNSCFSITPGFIKESVTNCYTGENTGLENRINLNGYYRMRPVNLLENPPKVYDFDGVDSTSEMSVIFYPDGMFVTGWVGVRTADYISEVVKDSKKAETFYTWARWGVYTISNDTIIVQWIDNTHPLAATWGGAEFIYKVIDRNTIEFISKRWFATPDQITTQYNTTRDIKEGEVYRGLFTPLDSIPPSEGSWLMRESWLWCDENKYDNWKASLKTGK